MNLLETERYINFNIIIIIIIIIGERVEGMGNGGVCWGVVELKGKSKAVKRLE